VLDFGLAKAWAGEPAFEATANSPTLPASALTGGGVLLGTAAYMSPEQARGRPVDKRADIFAFGVVLYEMLTGSQAFGGETMTDSLAAILTKEPDRGLLPETTPAGLRRLLDRCIEKDAKRRLRDIGEGRLLLEEAGTNVLALSQDRPGGLSLRISWAVAAVLAVTTALSTWLWLRTPQPQPRPVVRFTTQLVGRPGNPVLGLAISRDGTRLAFRGGQNGEIHLRMMDQLESRPLPGTAGNALPFFSPDGQWIGFAQQGKLKKVPVTGGAAVTLCDAGGGGGAIWAADGTILFASGPNTGLSRVSEAGGKPEVLTKLDAQKKETSHRLPRFLPEGEAVLFTIGVEGRSYDEARIAVLSLRTREQRVLAEGSVGARYAATGPEGSGRGHLVWWQAGSLFAAPFDARRLRLTGPTVPVLEGVRGAAERGFADWAFSDTGTLIYTPGQVAGEATLAWVDRRGQEQLLPAPPRRYVNVRLSPDGQRAALVIGERRTEGVVGDVWVYDLARNTLNRWTFESNSGLAVWTPDGQRLAFSVTRDGKSSLAWMPADGSGSPETLAEVAGGATSWSPDGKLLAFTLPGRARLYDLWLLPLEDRKPRPFLETPFEKRTLQFSADGRWVVYEVGRAGRHAHLRAAGPGARLRRPLAGD